MNNVHGHVFNIDEQTDDRKYVVAVEGPIDAIAIDGVAITRKRNQRTADCVTKQLW